MDELGRFERRGDTVDLRYERRYPRPIETVWAALTDPARLGEWLGAARVEPQVGGRYELFIDRKRPMTGRVLTWEPPRLLEFSWDTGDAPPSTVRCELTAEDAGTRLVFTHKGVGFVWIALVLPGWHHLLERLASLLAGMVQNDSMERWRELQASYLGRYQLQGVMLDPPPGHGS
jgi:uncharacterized protein YndB with AHSA1/START domain